MGRIPLLSVLAESEKLLDETVSAETSSAREGVTESTEDSKKNVTLLEWISASDNRNSMEQLYEMCSRGLEQVCCIFLMTNMLRIIQNLKCTG